MNFSVTSLCLTVVLVFLVHCTRSQKPGTCPAGPPKGIATPCIARCSNDTGCPCNQKCCSYGCERLCENPIPPKKGYCPRFLPLCVGLPKPPKNPCSDDSDCSGDLKCCPGCWGRQCETPTNVKPPPKQGNCPAVPLGVRSCIMFTTPPADACQSDDQCAGDNKCCPTACCKQQCVAPVGICPPSVPGQVGICIEECGPAKPCTGGKACCTNECGGHVCL